MNHKDDFFTKSNLSNKSQQSSKQESEFLKNDSEQTSLENVSQPILFQLSQQYTTSNVQKQSFDEKQFKQAVIMLSSRIKMDEFLNNFFY